VLADYFGRQREVVIEKHDYCGPVCLVHAWCGGADARNSCVLPRDASLLGLHKHLHIKIQS
jgi:hypothetical protein